MSLLLLVTLLSSGCARTDWKRSLCDDHGSLEAELEFWAGLEDCILVTRHDALHGLLLLDGECAEGEDYAARQQAASARGWWKTRDRPANESVRIGEVALAVATILELDAGLADRLFGRSERGSLRILLVEELLPPRSTEQGISGAEYLDLMARASDRLEDRRASP